VLVRPPPGAPAQLIELVARRRGATLVEAGIVGAVTALLAGVATPCLRTRTGNRRLEAAATRLAPELQCARNEAIARNLPVALAGRLASAAGPCPPARRPRLQLRRIGRRGLRRRRPRAV
jgi:hypothetical protein